MAGERRYVIEDLLTNSKTEGKTPLSGDYQSHNLKAVLSAFQNLQDVFTISDLNIKDGISKVVVNTGLAGRWQVLSQKPLTMCDTAHNKEGLEYVIKQINRIPKSALHIILGFVNDKDLDSVLPLFPAGCKILLHKGFSSEGHG